MNFPDMQGIGMILELLNEKRLWRAKLFILACISPFIINAIAALIVAMK